ncbi:alpha/beta hydrolase [Spirosoma arcticum]
MACQTEQISTITAANETFYVEQAGSAMRVNVRGNTASRVILLIVHGGPGGNSYLYRTPEVIRIIESQYAVAYWDQRNSGASQGGRNGAALTIPQFGDDLKRVIQVLKTRYGQATSLFIMGQSWGGIVTTEFVTKPGNQQLVNGWLFVNASHNYRLNDSLTKDMLIRFGIAELARNRNVPEWKPIVDYCKTVILPADEPTADKLNLLAGNALTLIEGFTPLDEDKVFYNKIFPPTDEYPPFTSSFVNLIATNKLDKQARNLDYSSRLGNVTLPVLICGGQYDFICPPGLGDDLFNRIRSTKKRRLLFLNTGHNLEEQTAYCQAFVSFMQENK